MYNPGTLPDITWNYLDIADITVIFEDTFTNFIDANKFNALKNFHSATNSTKSAFSIMLHSIGNIPDELLEWTAKEMKEMAEWNFATSVADAGAYWHSFSPIFSSYIIKYEEEDGV